MLIILIIGIFCFHFDHTVIYLMNMMDSDQQYSMIDFLDMQIYQNEGLIFGIMSDYHRLFIIVISFIMFGIGFFLLNFIDNKKYAKSGVKIALGGSLGNILHRLSCGHVHDYINFF